MALFFFNIRVHSCVRTPCSQRSGGRLVAGLVAVLSAADQPLWTS